MGEGDCDFGEKKGVEEGSNFAGDMTVVDDFVDEHQVLDEMSVRVQQFCFGEVLPSENSNTNAMIQMAEEKIEKLNRDRILIVQKLKERMKKSSELELRKYHDDYKIRHRERLNILQLSLDKLTFANNAYKGKPIKSCLSGGEVDTQKLSLLMVHGCKNMADERKLLREVDASQGKDGAMTVDELHAPIQHLLQKFRRHKKIDDDVTQNCNQAILKDINQQEIAREGAIANAVVNGKLWNSLGSKNAIEAELQALKNSSDEPRGKQGKSKANIRKVEKNISSLEKRLKDLNRKKGEVYNAILKLKKQNEEKKQVEKFMQQSNNCQNFRNDYEKRVVPFLNQHRRRTITNQKLQGDDT